MACYKIEEALRNRKKPCVGLIESLACSAGCYAISFCDTIGAINSMCQVGCIGVLTSFVDYSKIEEKMGVKTITILPPESDYKNLPEREAIDGDTSRYIKEQLSPMAVAFQNIIKENRPNLDLSEEGILRGKTFFAQDAIKNGLIDKIMSLEDAIQEVHTLSDKYNAIYSLKTN